MPSNQENTVHSADSIIQKAGDWGLVILVQSLLSIIWLLLIPKEPGNAVFLGYSLKRLVLLIPMSAPLVFSFSWILTKSRLKIFFERVTGKNQRPTTAFYLLTVGALLSFITWTFILIMPMVLHQIRRLGDFGIYYRLIPLAVNYLLIGLEAILFIPLILFQQRSQKNPETAKPQLKIFLVVFLILLSFFVLIEITGLGKNPERVSIITLGIPLLEGQIWYITGLILLAMLSLIAWQAIPAIARPEFCKHGDLVIATILWLVAVAVWMTLPLPNHNYFAPQAQPPNFEKYPFSDAEQYDYSSLYLLFGSVDNFVISKPLYVSFLAILHAIGGLSYANVIFFQTLVVALFPSVLYLIGREIHSRLGGIAIALFAIIREVNSILASTIANTSNTKLLLSDMPAALLGAILALVLIRWFKRKEKHINGHEFLIGGLIGLFIMMRIQTMVLVPFALVLVIFRYFPKVKTMLFSAVILLTTLALVISPILIRNHSITGVFWIDNPSTSSGLSRILTTGLEFNEDFDLQPMDNVISNNLQVFQNILNKNFGLYLYSVGDNFSRNMISTLLIFPVRLGNKIPIVDFLRINRPFWAEVYSEPNGINALIIVINLSLVALGFSITFKQNPKPVISLLGLFTVYNLSSAVVRLSGWRFILPLDWVIYVFFALGILEVFSWAFSNIAGWDIKNSATWLADIQINAGITKRNWTWYASFGFLFLLTGALIPIREHLLPNQLPDYSRQEVCEHIDTALAESAHSDLREEFMTFCLSEDTSVFKGYGIYPRYFKSGEGYYNRINDPWFGEQDYARLVFRLIGTRNAKVYIKTLSENIRFPNGATVYLAGRNNNKFEAQFVLVEGVNPELIISTSVLAGEEKLIPAE